MSGHEFDAESLRKVIAGQRVTFSGRRLYAVMSTLVTPQKWLLVILAPGEAYGMYPVDEEAEKAYRTWCAANAGDPVVDEVLADKYLMHVFTEIWSLPATVQVRHVAQRNENPPVHSLEMRPCS